MSWEPWHEWFHEFKIQQRIKNYFQQCDWELQSEADPLKREKGFDLWLKKDNINLYIEVKGYPSEYYVKGEKKRKKKKENKYLNTSQILVFKSCFSIYYNQK